MIHYIEALKEKLIAETEGFTYPSDTAILLQHAEKKDNYDIPTYVMVGDSEDGSKGEAPILHHRLENYRDSLLQFFPAGSNINLGIELNDAQTNEGLQPWEMANFYHTPLAASVALLSKMQTDVRNAEQKALQSLIADISRDILPFDTVTSKVMASSNYVLQGKSFKADVLLAAFSKTLKPEIYLGDLNEKGELTNVYDTLDIEAGLGKLEIPATAEGLHSVSGAIKFQKQDGSVNWYPFKEEYMVAKPALVVSAVDMNVLYKGPDIAMNISVPGVPSEKLKVAISGSGNSIRKTAAGKYVCKLSNRSPRDVAISCSVENDDGSYTPVGKMQYVAKKLPKPYAKVGRVESGIVMKLPGREVQQYNTLRGLYSDDFMFNLPLTIAKFDVEIMDSRTGYIKEYRNNRGNKLQSSKAANDLRSVKKGDIVYITNIQIRDVAGNKHRANDITIRVI